MLNAARWCVADKLRKDLINSKEETHSAVQEGMLHKQNAGKLEVEIEGVRDRERILCDQVILGILIVLFDNDSLLIQHMWDDGLVLSVCV